jgi:hypothetical protein
MPITIKASDEDYEAYELIATSKRIKRGAGVRKTKSMMELDFSAMAAHSMELEDGDAPFETSIGGPGNNNLNHQ